MQSEHLEIALFVTMVSLNLYKKYHYVTF